MTNPFKAMDPFKQSSKTMLHIFLTRILLTLLLLVFFFIIAVVSFAQNVNPANGLDENGMCNAFPDPVANPTDIIGKWRDRGTLTVADFGTDGTVSWERGRQDTNHLSGEFNYKIEDDKLILKDGVVILRINYLDDNTLTLTDGGCEHPTYIFQRE
jgi:hypothetical protein